MCVLPLEPALCSTRIPHSGDHHPVAGNCHVPCVGSWWRVPPGNLPWLRGILTICWVKRQGGGRRATGTVYRGRGNCEETLMLWRKWAVGLAVVAGCLLAASAALARQGMIITRAGRAFEGDMEEGGPPGKVVIRDKREIKTALPRTAVDKPFY